MPGESAPEAVFILESTLPNRDDAPSESVQLAPRALISHPVGREFMRPRCAVTRRVRPPLTAGVSVPEAPIDKNDRPVRCHDEVRLPRQARDMTPELKPQVTEHATNAHLRARVVWPNRCHNPRAGCAIDRVHCRGALGQSIGGRVPSNSLTDSGSGAPTSRIRLRFCQVGAPRRSPPRHPLPKPPRPSAPPVRTPAPPPPANPGTRAENLQPLPPPAAARLPPRAHLHPARAHPRPHAG